MTEADMTLDEKLDRMGAAWAAKTPEQRRASWDAMWRARAIRFGRDNPEWRTLGSRVGFGDAPDVILLEAMKREGSLPPDLVVGEMM